MLLFLIYVNDLSQTSNILDLIMFADGTNLFYCQHQIKFFLKQLIVNCKRSTSGLKQIDYP